jgi:hypothetical protein
MAEPQSYKNHSRWDPFFHFFLAPIFFLTIPASVLWYVHHRHAHLHSGLWVILISIALFAGLLNTRRYALMNQDRLIRLEEQLRLADLLPEKHLGIVDKISIKQYVALRFAADAELAALALRANAENLTPKQIKESIVTWRPDNNRI